MVFPTGEVAPRFQATATQVGYSSLGYLSAIKKGQQMAKLQAPLLLFVCWLLLLLYRGNSATII